MSGLLSDWSALRRTYPELAEGLRPFAARLRRYHLLTWLVRGGAAGLLLAILAYWLAWFTHQSGPGRFMGFAFGLCLLGGVGLGLWRRHTPLAAARLADSHGLEERAVTALWCPTSPDFFRVRQRRDALDHLARIDARLALPFRVPRREAMVSGLCALALLALVFLPTPMRTDFARQAGVAAAIDQAAERLKQVAETIQRQAQAYPQPRAEATLATLEELLDRLRRSRTADEAMNQLGLAAERLGGLGPGSSTLQQQALAQVAEAFRRTDPTRAVGQAMTADDWAAARSAMKELAEAVPEMGREERQSLAEALAGAADAAQGELAGLASLLAQAETAVRSGSSAAAGGALSQLAQQLAATGSQVAAGKAVAAAQSAVATAISSISQAQSGRATIAAGQVGQGGNTLRSDSGGQANPSSGGSSGAGQRLANSGQGSSGPGRTPGQAGQPGSSSGGASPSGEGRLEQIYVAERLGGDGDASQISGRLGEGGDSQQVSLNSPLGLGTLVPYQQVLAQYAQLARDNLARAEIPPALKDLVREYFSLLEGEGR